jgi:ribosomal protein L30/L7E
MMGDSYPIGFIKMERYERSILQLLGLNKT